MTVQLSSPGSAGINQAVFSRLKKNVKINLIFVIHVILFAVIFMTDFK